MRKVISLFLSIVMLISTIACVDFSAFADDYIEIWNIEDLDNINLAMGEKYKLMADIDMTYDTAEGGAYNNNGWGWKPIGYDNTMTTYTEFTGEFDGNGYSLIGINVNYNTSDGAKHCGLFASNSGIIKNLNIVDSTFVYSINANLTCIGSIVGDNKGEVSNCSFNGVINCKTVTSSYTPMCGGIVGRNYGYKKILNCFNNGTIKYMFSSYYRATGGICGYNESEGYISNCYNTGIINDGQISGNVGELSGFGITTDVAGNLYQISNCYNIGKIGRMGTVGSVGANYSKNIYCLEDVSKKIDTGVTVLNKTQSTMQSMYKGFDFKDTWIIDPTSTYKYPQLRDNRQDKIKSMETLELVEIPAKTTYYQNDLLDITGGKLKVNYTNGETEYIDITDKMVTGFDSTKVGEQTLTVRFRNKTVTYDINVKTRPVISNVELLSIPDTTTFVKGTKFDFSGAVVRITYAIGTSEDVKLTSKNVTGYNIDKIGNQTITYQVGDYAVSFDIEVIPVTIDKIGNQTITYQVGDYAVSFDIEVIPVTIDKIEIQSIPDKTVYYDGEEFDLTGLKVKATYNNGLTRILDNEEFEVSGFGESIDTNTITVNYSDVSTTFDITYHKPNGSWTTITEATCTVDGKKVQYCRGCGEIAKTQIITAFGHTEVVDNAVSATCTKSGLTQGSHCSVCGTTIIEQNVVSALNHIYTSEITRNATCTTKGIRTYICQTCGDLYIEEIEMIEHTPVTDTAVTPTCIKTGLTVGSHCSVCDEIIVSQKEIKATGHTYVSAVTEPTCKEQGYATYTCSMCGDSYKTDYTDVTNNHNYKTVVTKPATCTETGVKTTTCTICGDSRTEAIEMIEHTSVTDAAVEPTCAKTGLTEGSHCSVCDEIIVSQKEIKATGHTYVSAVTEPTCKEQGYATYTCSMCGDSYKTDYTDVTNNHNYKTVVTKPATCTETGVKTTTCTICGDSRTEAIEMIEHTSVTDAAVEPTCAKTGLTEGSHCSVCGAIIESQKVIKANGHCYESVITEPTCVSKGYTTHICSECNDSYRDNYVSIIAHDYACTVTKLATCSSDGEKRYTCQNCENCYTESIEKLGHSFVNYEYDNNETCITNGTKTAKCERCEMIDTIEVDGTAKGHDYTSKITKNQSCTETGEKTFTCNNCGDIYTEKIVKKAHNYVTTTTKATTNKNGSVVTKCSVCGDIKSTTSIAYPKTITLSKTSYTYNDKVQKPTVTVKDSNGNNISASNYTVTYASGRKNVGKYSVKITFKGNYSGSKTLYFTINPKATTLSSVKAKSKGFTVKWKKQTTQTTGYEIQYATDSKFTKNKKTVTINKNKTTTKTISKLEAKKKYYIRVRSYKTVDGKKYYSAWSSVKSIKCK